MHEEGSAVRFPLLRNARVITAEGAPREMYLQHGGGIDALHGQDAQAVVDSILPRIDGFATAEEIIAAVAQTGAVTADRARRILRWLIEAGICVEDRQEPGDDPLRRCYQAQIKYFSGYTSSPTVCQKRLQASRVAVVGLEYFGSMLMQHLAAAGVGCLRAIGNPRVLPAEAAFLGVARRRTGVSRHTLLCRRTRALGLATQYEGIDVQPGDLLDWPRLLADCNLAVLILPAWLPSLILPFNQACLARGTPFLPLWLDGASSHIGPLVMPYETACLLCLELRQRSRWTRADFRSIQQQHAEATGPVWDESRFSIPWVTAIAAIAAGEIVTALAQERQPASRGHTLGIDAQHWQMQPSPVLKVPRCPACSRLRYTPSSQPFALRHKKDQNDGSAPELAYHACR